MEDESKTEGRLSGGETDDRVAYLRLRALILAEPDVYAVLALSWVPAEQRWLYLIKTPFATWPKYVVGYTDAANEEVEIMVRCGQEANGRAAFDELNLGEHT